VQGGFTALGLVFILYGEDSSSFEILRNAGANVDVINDPVRASLK
jgi:hypothetical protein